MGNLVLDSDLTNPLKPITDYPTPLGDYLSAQAGSAFQSIEDRYSTLSGFTPDRTIVGYNPDGYPVYGQDPSQTKVLPDQAQAELDAAGVKMKAPTDGMYRDTLDALVQRQQEQTARAVAIAGSPTGARSVLGFGVQAATSMLDPINIAASFVPVIGPLKYTGMLADAGSALGRAGIRFGVGAAEGAAGAAVTQPLDYLAAKNAGDDYTMTTALQNIAFGAAFGAGLHTIGGAAHDVVAGAPERPMPPTVHADVPDTLPDNPATAPDISTRAGQQPIVVRLETGDVPISPLGSAWMNNSVSHETRIAATTTSVSQLLDGRNVEVNPIIRADPDFQYRMATQQQPTDMASALTQAHADVEPQLRAELTAQAGNAADPGAVTQMRSQLDQINTELAQPPVPSKGDIRALQSNQRLKYSDAAAQAQQQLDARRADLEQQATRLSQAIETNRQATQASQDLATLNRGEIPDRYQDRMQQRAEQLLQGDPMTAAIKQLYSPSPESDLAAAQRQNAPENVAVADPDMSRAADERMTSAPEGLRNATADGAEQAMNDAQIRFQDAIDNLKRSGLSDESIASLQKELEPFDIALKDSDNLGKAARAAAICGVSRG